MRVAPTFVLLAALALPAFAASADPMTPFNYYAGEWSCSEGMIGGSDAQEHMDIPFERWLDVPVGS